MHDAPLLHVVFGHSAAKALRDALRDLGRDEHVAVYPDDLGYGPINPPSVDARARFRREVMLVEDNTDIGGQTNAFWADVATRPETQVAWFSRRSVQEYAGFHEYVSRRTSPPLFVDVADVPLVNRDGTPSSIAAECFAYIGSETFVRMNLLSRVARMTAGAFDDARQCWERSKREDARLRVLDSSGLVSAALTYFDDTIIASVSSRLERTDEEIVETTATGWQQCSKVVGDALYRCNTRGFDQVRDSFVWFRLRELVKNGRLDSKGDTSSMWDSFVRAR